MCAYYTLIEESMVLEETQYTGYGIKASNGLSVPDISTDKTFVEKIVTTINREDVQPEHLLDIVEDFIA